MTFNPNKHRLVPKHSKLSDKEKAKLLEDYGITVKELPKILINDVALEGLDANEADIIKVTRHSITAGETVYYRSVING
ncbi:DNA-directed RNA polymerase subunit H [Candidatus Woesearchaeota archaeon]|jgi:DNA-directed RNA polymerase subunit H (RpoH/RPB5)|nr:DNA-directed RNA polymerase subunit H [Candidatus Woesearchaeota archaeon]